MQVIINEQAYEYHSDFPEGWKFSSGDPFKFPVKIGRHACFIKLFRKPVTKIAGWDLMSRLKGKNSRNLPRIHDICNSEINGAEVQYVFYEYLPGENLDLLIARGDEIDLIKLAEGIFAALKSIQTAGYWFADFCEKNIYRDATGRFILLDLDSCIPLSVPPRTDAQGNKDYWSPVYYFYRDVLGYSQIKTEDLPGNCLNILQLYMMVFRIHKFYQLPKEQRNYIGVLNKLHLMLIDKIKHAKELYREIFPAYELTEYGFVPEAVFMNYISEILDPKESGSPAILNLTGSPDINQVQPRQQDLKPSIVENTGPDGPARPVDLKPSIQSLKTQASEEPVSGEEKIWDPRPKQLERNADLKPTIIENAAKDVPSGPVDLKPATSTAQKKEEYAAIVPPFLIDLAVDLENTAKKPVIATSNSWRLVIATGLTALTLAAGILAYLEIRINKKSDTNQEDQVAHASTLENTKQIPVTITLSPDTLVLVARQFEAVNMTVAAPISSVSDLSVEVNGKPIPPNLISLKPAKNLSVVTIFIDSAYHSGEIKIQYPGLKIASKTLTIIKIKNRRPRLFHEPVIVNYDEKTRQRDSEANRRNDSLKRIRQPEVEVPKRAYRAAIQTSYFEFNRGEGLMHKIFSKKQYLIRGHGFLNAKNGFEVFDLHERLEVKIQNDSLLLVKSPKKVRALLLKLLPRGSSDTLWVRAK